MSLCGIPLGTAPIFVVLYIGLPSSFMKAVPLDVARPWGEVWGNNRLDRCQHIQARNQGGFGGFVRTPLFANPPSKITNPPPRSNFPTPYLASDSKHARFWCSSSDWAHRTDLLGPLLTTLRTPSTLHLIHQLRQIAWTSPKIVNTLLQQCCRRIVWNIDDILQQLTTLG